MKIFLRVLCVLLAVLFTLGIFAASAVSVAVWSVRSALSPEAVSSAAVNLDFASVRFPDGFGGFTTVPEQLNQVLGQYGGSISDEGFNSLCRQMSLDLVLRDFLLDFRSWLLDDGPVPTIDPRETAERVVSGMNSGALAVFSDPVSFTASLIGSFINERTVAARIEALSPARDLLSVGTLVFAVSAAIGCAVLLYFALRTRLFPTLTFSGLALSLAGAAAYLGQPLAKPYKNSLLLSLSMPESTFDIVYRPLMNKLSRTGFAVMIAGAALCLSSALLWIAVSVHRRGEADRNARTAPYVPYAPYAPYNALGVSDPYGPAEPFAPAEPIEAAEAAEPAEPAESFEPADTVEAIEADGASVKSGAFPEAPLEQLEPKEPQSPG